MLTITKEGIKKVEWDSDFRSQCKIKKKDGKHVVIDKETGKVIAVGHTREESEEIFYREVPIEHIYVDLRNQCEIEPDVTLGDLYDIIEESDDLEALLSHLYPLYKDLRNDLDLGDFVIRKDFFIEDNNLVIQNESDKPSVDVEMASLVVHNSNVYRDQKLIYENVPIPYSFYDVLESVFGELCGFSDKKIKITRDEIVCDGEPVRDLVPYLNCECDIEKGVTLGDIFNIVSRDEMLMAFMSCYSWCNVRAYHEEALKPLEKSNLTFLEVDKQIVVYLDKDKSPRSFEGFLNEANFGAYGPPEEKKEGGPDLIPWGIDFTPLNKLVTLPVKLRNLVEFREEYWSHKYRKPGEPLYNSLGQIEVTYTLLEILDAIYWEISFHGNPENRNERKAELDERVKEIEEGNVEGTSAEDVFKELELDDEDDE